MWCEEDLGIKRKLSYYKKVINPTLENQKYLSILTSSKNKINIAKIRTNSHDLHSKTGRWAVPKTPWMERICHICENRNIEDENHFLLECPAYNHIRSQFHNICYNTDLPSLLQCQNYSECYTVICHCFYFSVPTVSWVHNHVCPWPPEFQMTHFPKVFYISATV